MLDIGAISVLAFLFSYFDMVQHYDYLVAIHEPDADIIGSCGTAWDYHEIDESMIAQVSLSENPEALIIKYINTREKDLLEVALEAYAEGWKTKHFYNYKIWQHLVGPYKRWALKRMLISIAHNKLVDAIPPNLLDVFRKDQLLFVYLYDLMKEEKEVHDLIRTISPSQRPMYIRSYLAFWDFVQFDAPDDLNDEIKITEETYRSWIASISKLGIQPNTIIEVFLGGPQYADRSVTAMYLFCYLSSEYYFLGKTQLEQMRLKLRDEYLQQLESNLNLFIRANPTLTPDTEREADLFPPTDYINRARMYVFGHWLMQQQGSRYDLYYENTPMLMFSTKIEFELFKDIYMKKDLLFPWCRRYARFHGKEFDDMFLFIYSMKWVNDQELSAEDAGNFLNRYGADAFVPYRNAVKKYKSRFGEIGNPTEMYQTFFSKVARYIRDPVSGV